ncbi:7682_t:CDS:10, partial [Cetraspora pellucida]
MWRAINLQDQEKNKQFWAEDASQWYRKLYNHLVILAGQDEFKTLYYYCRSLMVDTPYMAAREPLIWSFESNQLVYQITWNDFYQVGLEFFDQNLEIFIDKLFRLKDIQSYNDTNGTRLTTSTNMDFNQILELDPTFAEESRLTFTDTLVRFLTEITHKVSPFIIKEIIEFPSNIEDSNSIDRLHPLPLTEDWELQPYMFEHVPKPHIKFVDDDIKLVINNINDDLNLISDQDSKSRHRARIMELSYLLTKNIIGLDFNIEDITFTSSLKLFDETSDKENDHPSNLYTEDDETSPVTTKSTDFSNNEYISDHNESDDEWIMELKSRKQELENLLAAT